MANKAERDDPAKFPSKWHRLQYQLANELAVQLGHIFVTWLDGDMRNANHEVAPTSPPNFSRPLPAKPRDNAKDILELSMYGGRMWWIVQGDEEVSLPASSLPHAVIFSLRHFITHQLSQVDETPGADKMGALYRSLTGSLNEWIPEMSIKLRMSS